MINYMNIEDLEQGVQLLNKHIKDFAFAKDFTKDNSMYYRELLKNLIREKTVIISKDEDNIINGVLIGAKAPNSLDPYKTQLHIIVNWVREDKRGSSIFYRMNSFLDKEFTNIDKIYAAMPGLTNVNFEKLGYKQVSINYIKEKNA